MRFIFNEKKAAQAAAYLLKLNGGQMKYLKLIKLLYLADRECLLKTGCPITRDRYVSMDNGPVLSRVYDLIREEPENADDPWYQYISAPEDYTVRLRVQEPDLDELSRYETALLESCFERFRALSGFDLAKLTHKICPEWRDPQGAALPIAPEEILRVEGKTPEEIEQIRREALDLELIESLEDFAAPITH